MDDRIIVTLMHTNPENMRHGLVALSTNMRTKRWFWWPVPTASVRQSLLKRWSGFQKGCFSLKTWIDCSTGCLYFLSCSWYSVYYHVVFVFHGLPESFLFYISSVSASAFGICHWNVPCLWLALLPLKLDARGGISYLRIPPVVLMPYASFKQTYSVQSCCSSATNCNGSANQLGFGAKLEQEPPLLGSVFSSRKFERSQLLRYCRPWSLWMIHSWKSGTLWSRLGNSFWSPVIFWLALALALSRGILKRTRTPLGRSWSKSKLFLPAFVQIPLMSFRILRKDCK